MVSVLHTFVELLYMTCINVFLMGGEVSAFRLPPPPLLRVLSLHLIFVLCESNLHFFCPIVGYFDFKSERVTRIIHEKE